MASQYENQEAIQTRTEQTTKKEGRVTFFGYTTQSWLWFTCTRCSSLFHKLQMFWYQSDAI